MAVQRLDPVVRCGIPGEVGETLRKLLRLYATPPPNVVNAIPAAISTREDVDEEDSLGEEEDGDYVNNDAAGMAGGQQDETQSGHAGHAGQLRGTAES